MIAAAFAAAAVLHTPTLSPTAQLAAVQRVAAFHVYVLPVSLQLLRAEASRDGSKVRIEYSTEGVVIDVDETPAEATASPTADENAQAFNLNGYPAIYREFSGFRELSTLTWYRSDVIVTLSSRDRVNAPLLVDIALELR